MINSADVSFLFLPDYAAAEIGINAPLDKRIIDASTAHRTNKAWTYGFPELGDNQRELIKSTKRLSVPGCHATGFIALIKPLVLEGVISNEEIVGCTSLTGYSGGGKKMIDEYENNLVDEMKFPRIYGLGQAHKHLPEMTQKTGLLNNPMFVPIVTNYYSGMVATIPLDNYMNKKKISTRSIADIYMEYYSKEEMIKVLHLDPDFNNGMIDIGKMSGRDDMEIMVYGNQERIILSARYDNLGKGASGAAVQCMNIMLGIDETTSLRKGNDNE